MAVDLSVNFCGLRFKNPVLTASCELAENRRGVRKSLESGVGGVVTKTITTVPYQRQRTTPARWMLTRADPKVSVQSMGWPGLSSLSPEEWLTEELPVVQILCAEAGAQLIVSTASDSPEEWAALSASIVEAGVKMLELNLSCPVTRWSSKGKGTDRTPASDPEVAYSVVEMVKKAVGETPVMPKLSPLLGGVEEIARACKEAGADAIAGCNGYRGLLIDVEKEEPFGPPFVSGFSPGRVFKPLSLAVMAQVAMAVDLPLSGIGGINEGRDALEYMLLGCTTVQVAKAALYSGRQGFPKILKGIAEFMEKKGYSSIDEFRGKVGKQLVYPADYPSFVTGLGKAPEVRPVMEVEKCNGCGICVLRCTYGAWTQEVKKGIPKLDDSLCDSCGTCVSSCLPGALCLQDRRGNVIWTGRGASRPWPD